jgi:hypothetical protein
MHRSPDDVERRALGWPPRPIDNEMSVHRRYFKPNGKPTLYNRFRAGAITWERLIGSHLPYRRPVARTPRRRVLRRATRTGARGDPDLPHLGAALPIGGVA